MGHEEPVCGTATIGDLGSCVGTFVYAALLRAVLVLVCERHSQRSLLCYRYIRPGYTTACNQLLEPLGEHAKPEVQFGRAIGEAIRAQTSPRLREEHVLSHTFSTVRLDRTVQEVARHRRHYRLCARARIWIHAAPLGRSRYVCDLLQHTVGVHSVNLARRPGIELGAGTRDIREDHPSCSARAFPKVFACRVGDARERTSAERAQWWIAPLTDESILIRQNRTRDGLG